MAIDPKESVHPKQQDAEFRRIYNRVDEAEVEAKKQRSVEATQGEPNRQTRVNNKFYVDETNGKIYIQIKNVLKEVQII